LMRFMMVVTFLVVIAYRPFTGSAIFATEITPPVTKPVAIARRYIAKSVIDVSLFLAVQCTSRAMSE
jgi:hypothetical protein